SPSEHGCLVGYNAIYGLPHASVEGAERFYYVLLITREIRTQTRQQFKGSENPLPARYLRDLLSCRSHGVLILGVSVLGRAATPSGTLLARHSAIARLAALS